VHVVHTLGPSVTIHLIRHGSAGRRTATGRDIDRSLDQAGMLEAERLVRWLSSSAWSSPAVQQVMSSPATRCAQTVAPLAAALDLTVIVTQDLFEGEPVAGSMGLIRRLAASDTHAVLCTHGDIIPSLLEELAAAAVPLHGNGCAKGSIWTLSTLDGAIAEAHYTAHP
jgi:phosphohistidine phosphatase SixA